MDSKTIEIYMMIGSSEPIVKWLKDNGVRTKKSAVEMLRGAAQSNVIGAISYGSGGTIAATSNTINRVLKEFPEKEAGVVFKLEYDNQIPDVVNKISSALSEFNLEIKEIGGGDGIAEYEITKTK